MTSKVSFMPRRLIRYLLVRFVFWLQQRRTLAQFAVRTIRLSPTLERHAIRFVQVRGVGLSLKLRDEVGPSWKLDAEPEAIEKWTTLLN